MHGRFAPCLVYGFWEMAQGKCLDPDWVKARGAEVFSDAVVRQRLNAACYGTEASCDPSGAVAVVDEDRGAAVQDLFERYCSHRRARGAREEDLPALGFFLALRGDYVNELCEYTVDDG